MAVGDNAGNVRIPVNATIQPINGPEFFDVKDSDVDVFKPGMIVFLEGNFISLDTVNGVGPYGVLGWEQTETGNFRPDSRYDFFPAGSRVPVHTGAGRRVFAITKNDAIVPGSYITFSTSDLGYVDAGNVSTDNVGQSATYSQPIPGATGEYFIMVNLWR